MSRMKPAPTLANMDDAELRSLIKSCEAQERRLKAPYNKARRGWRNARLEAEAELARRTSHFANPSYEGLAK